MKTENEHSGDALLQARQWFERTEKALHGFYAEYPLNEFWKKYNTPQMLDILRTSENDAQALDRIQQTYFFVVKLTGDAAEKALQWQWERLSRDNPRLLSAIETIGESHVVPPSLTLPHHQKRYSVDIFRVARIADNVMRHCAIEEGASPVFFELGAGLGHLARFLLHRVPAAKYVISDLPLSLCFSFIFLRHNFPSRRICLLEADQELSDELLARYDIILASPKILRQRKAIRPDVFINTCSLGEMENSVSAQWFDFIETRLQPNYLYSLNRFLNHIDASADYQWRTNENAHLSGVGKDWEVRRFSLGDASFFSPYLACIHPRYLELILCRTPQRAEKAPLDALEADLRAHASLSLYGGHGWAINYYGTDLSPDLSEKGELFACWNAARLAPGPRSHLLLLLLLDRLNRHGRMPFEETKYLESTLSLWAKKLSGTAGAELEKFMEHRAVHLYGDEKVGAVMRNQPCDLDALFAALRVEPRSHPVVAWAKDLLRRA